MTDTPHADALLTALISGGPLDEGFADLTEEHERQKALHVLIAMLTDPDHYLHGRAIKALEILGDERAMEPLIRSLEVNESDFDYVRDVRLRITAQKAIDRIKVRMVEEKQ
jgi:HEAT repeat protein